MQLKSLFSKWTQVAGLLLMGGALTWTAKLCVIISTNGQVINTGAAAILMTTGLVLLAIGSTGVGTRLTVNRALLLRAIAIILSPVVVFGLFFLFGMIIVPLFKDSSVWYAQQEAPIGVAVVLSFALGYLLYKSYKPAIK
jgi:hypothetical protein